MDVNFFLISNVFPLSSVLRRVVFLIELLKQKIRSMETSWGWYCYFPYFFFLQSRSSIKHKQPSHTHHLMPNGIVELHKLLHAHTHPVAFFCMDYSEKTDNWSCSLFEFDLSRNMLRDTLNCHPRQRHFLLLLLLCGMPISSWRLTMTCM